MVPFLQIFAPRRSVMMILNLSESHAKPHCHSKTEHGIFVKFKKPSKTACCPHVPDVAISGTPCPRHITVPFGCRTAPSLATWPRPEQSHLLFIMVPYLQIYCARPKRYDDFKLIRITRQAACHGKTEHGIFVKFKENIRFKTAVSLHCRL